MRAVGLKVLKNKLSEYVRLVASGETVLVTDREQVVAELVPPQAGRSGAPADALLADAMRQGLVSAPLLVSVAAPTRKPTTSLADVLRALDTDRGDR